MSFGAASRRLSCQRRSAVTLLAPGRRLSSGGGTEIDGDVWPRAGRFAEADVLVGADNFVLEPPPGAIGVRRAAVAWADPLPPVVIADEIPAGPTQPRHG